jgi:ABC-type sugar transport system ATPase subunit
MLGRNLTDDIYGAASRQKPPRPRGRKVLSVENLSMANVVRNTGIFGLVGSGRTETMKIVAGVLKRDFFHGGEIKLDGRAVRYVVPTPAVRDGIVYVTEERKAEGFFETMSIAENIYLNKLSSKRLGGFRFVSMAEARRLAADWRKRLNIRAIDPARR